MSASPDDTAASGGAPPRGAPAGGTSPDDVSPGGVPPGGVPPGGTPGRAAPADPASAEAVSGKRGRRAGLATGRLASGALSVLLLLAIWSVVAVWLDDNALPTPLAVWHSLVTEWRSGDLLFHLSATLVRVICAFVVAMTIGSAIGIRLGTSEAIDRIVDPWLILLLNIPALVIIVLAYIWFGLNEAAAIGAVAVNKIPNVVVTMREGARAL